MRRGTAAAISFGAVIRELRMDKHLSMNALGRILGIPASTVSQVEKAQRALKEDQISKWADALGVHESYLREKWELCQDEFPEPPIVRKRVKAGSVEELYMLISTLSSTDRQRVLGYVEGLIERNNHATP